MVADVITVVAPSESAATSFVVTAGIPVRLVTRDIVRSGAEGGTLLPAVVPAVDVKRASILAGLGFTPIGGRSFLDDVVRVVVGV